MLCSRSFLSHSDISESFCNEMSQFSIRKSNHKDYKPILIGYKRTYRMLSNTNNGYYTITNFVVNSLVGVTRLLNLLLTCHKECIF